MLKNLFKTAIRNILRDKFYTLVNVLGLTIGITCSVFLLFYVLDELSYDRYHANAPNIYRIVSNIKEPDNEFTWAVAQIPMAPELRDKFSEVKDAVRFFSLGRRLYKHGVKQFYEEDFYLADSTVFEVFSYEFLYGNPDIALDEPNAVVLTESIAVKYFDKVNALGESLTNQDGDELKVTGIIKDVPHNSHFIFDALISRSSIPEYRGSWGSFGVFTYIMLPDNYNVEDMQPNFESVLKEHINPIFESIGITINYELQPIRDIHLYSKIQDEAEHGGDISYIYIFLAIATFMLIIAAINYMNLATARSVKRAKEVGIRKVMGSQKGQLIVQFMTESVTLSVIALVVSIGLIYIFLPSFNNLANKSIGFGYLLDPQILLILLGTVIFVGIIGGSYPAFYLSSFNPANVMKGTTSHKGGNPLLRKGLVIFQFCISIFMLVSTLVVFNQLEFMRSKDLGFSKDQVVRVEMPSGDLRQKYQVLRNRLLQNSSIISVASSSSSPGNNVGKVIFNVESEDGEMIERGIDFFNVDYDFVTTMEMKVVQGRNFSREVLTDTTEAVLVNEAMVRRMNWSEPLGKKFEMPTRGPDPQVAEVIGVLKDYHQNSLYSEIEPLMVRFRKTNYFMFAKIAGGSITETVAAMEKDWKAIHGDFPFEYEFLDQDFDSQYQADVKRGKIFTIFSILTIIIACLGLLGLASFTTEQRTKEIGIRKVIGAGVQTIVLLVSKEFFILILIAVPISFFGSYYFLKNWLANFAYGIELQSQVGTFVLSAVLALTITFLTIAFHTIRAATRNPVNALRME
ncbi:ABC transporter permease [Fulvivirgaceae bacterium BMA10]|uniref:ABC transporter permease n=1 Tax=Splendidivirga corallicola TaxID=3051826 RepID=A0ABT8KT84_9BACT|nr:ABC transporter permease [Fulvivirgaceae bacterium BMA10]